MQQLLCLKAFCPSHSPPPLACFLLAQLCNSSPHGSKGHAAALNPVLGAWHTAIQTPTCIQLHHTPRIHIMTINTQADPKVLMLHHQA